MSPIEIFRKAEHERVNGNRVEADRLYRQIIDNTSFSQDYPEEHFSALKMVSVTARLMGDYGRAASYERRVEEEAARLGLPLYDYWRDCAEWRRKKAAGLDRNDPVRADLLSRARVLLGDSEYQIMEESRIHHIDTAKPKGATLYHLVRLMVTAGDDWEEIKTIMERSHFLLEQGAPHEKLYQGLDQAEIFAYIGRGRLMLGATIRQLVWSSWRYGNRRPPVHMIRAGFNLAMICLPLRTRRRVLERHGWLIKSRPRTAGQYV